MFFYKDCIVDTTNSSGLDDFELNDISIEGGLPFDGNVTNGVSFGYRASNKKNANWEVGEGTYNLGKITRDIILASSSSGNKVDFPEGLKTIVLTIVSSQMQTINDAVFNGNFVSDKVGFFNTTPISKPVVTGGNTTDAIQSMISALSDLGMIENDTSVSIDTAPTTPTGFTATATSSSNINLSCNESIDDVGVTGYEFYRDGLFLKTTVNTSASDSGLSPGEIHTYKARAYDISGNTSAFSNEATARTYDTIAPTGPITLNSTLISNTEVKLDWSGGEDNVEITGWRLTRNSVDLTPDLGLVNTVNITGLTPDETYTFSIKAMDAAGNLGPASNDTVIITTVGASDVDAPTVPESLSATAAGASQINLAWTASTDAVGVTGYKIFRGGVQIDTSLTNSYPDNNVIPEATYSYTVKAYDAAGNVSGNSNTATATTAALSGIFVATTGSDTTGNGSIGTPYKTISKGLSVAFPGDTVYVRNGIYSISSSIAAVNGASGNRINLFAYPGELPVIDGTNQGADQWGIFGTNKSWMYIKGFGITNCTEGGIRFDGNSSNNIIENCDISYSGRLGTAGTRGTGVAVYGSAANNQFINCDSHHNRSTVPSDSDGFQISSTGTGNSLTGCRSWLNSDDGFDFFCVQDNLSAKPVTLINCWSWKNGYAADGSTGLGNGTGFKLGGRRANTSGQSGGNILKNCLAYQNRDTGISENSSIIPNHIYNCTSSNNAALQFYFPGTYNSGVNSGIVHVLKNNLAYLGTLGTVSPADDTFNSWNLGFTVNASDFVSTDPLSTQGARKSDGSLPDTTYLNLVLGSDLIDVGTPISGMTYTGVAPDLGAFEYRTTVVNNVATGLNITSTVSDISLAKAMGATYARFDCAWAWTMYGGSTSYDWTYLDSIIPVILSNGLIPIAIIDTCPQWATLGNDADYWTEPDDVNDIIPFLQAVAGRYPLLKIWETWNEPNIAQFWKPTPNPVKYTALVKVCYNTLKAIDTNNIILAGAWAPYGDATSSPNNPIAFLTTMYANGVQGYFDAISHHPYCYADARAPNFYEHWSAWSQMQDTNPSLRSVMIANGDGAKKIWGTEFGAPTGGTTAERIWTEQEQADLITRSYALFRTYSWAGPVFIIHRTKDYCNSATDSECYFGLINYNGVNKPGYDAFVKAGKYGTNKIFIIGDSTMALFPSSRAPMQGIGKPLTEKLIAKATVVNTAMSGASAKTYLNNSVGNWTLALSLIKSGDYVFIHLGHNDENDSTAAEYKTNITIMVTDCKAKGAIPVLVTSVTRRVFSGSIVTDNHAYVPKLYEIAAEQSLQVIQLYELSKALVQSYGVEGSKQLYLYTTAGQYPYYPSGVSDNTHFQEFGADKMADLVVNEINRLNIFGISTPVPGLGSLSISKVDGAATVNLETEGIIDWYKYGYGVPSDQTIIQKIIGSIIHPHSMLTADTVGVWTSEHTISWSNGTPNASYSANHTGLYVRAVGAGFRITIDANSTQKTAKLYVDQLKGTCRLTASLSDNSANSVSLDFAAGTTELGTVFIVPFKSANPATLTLTLSIVSQSTATVAATLQAITVS